MNLGIVTSFIIGGLLLVSIITLNSRVIQNSGETVLDMSAKGKIETVSEVITRDFNRMGINMSDPNLNPIVQDPTSNKIVFLADLDDDRSASSPASKITWQIVTNGAGGKSLQRTNDATSDTLQMVVKNIQLSFYNKYNSPTTDREKIRSIGINLEVEANESYGNSSKANSFLEKRFTPPALNLTRIN